MNRRKERRLTPAERRSLLLVAAFLLAAIGLPTSIHLGQHEIVPPQEIITRSGQDLRVLLADLRHDKARLYRVEGENGAPIRLFLKAHDREHVVVTSAACRRCARSARFSHLSNGELICGHCGDPMPLLEEGAKLPDEKDCTPVPVPYRIDGGVVVVQASDIEAGKPLFTWRSD